MDGFSEIIKKVALYCGLPEEGIITTGKKKLTIPGFFRPTKMWDALVVHNGRLIAAFELKSQVGSFDNFNNRTEEFIGSAKDFWTAQREKAFELSNHVSNNLFSSIEKDSKPPFLGYLMLLEECEASTHIVRLEEEYFKVFNEFNNTSYADRYQILCSKLVMEGLHSSSCLILSNQEDGLATGEFSSPSESLNPKSLFADFAARILSDLETYEK